MGTRNRSKTIKSSVPQSIGAPLYMCAMDLDGNGGPAMMTLFFFVFVALCAVDALFSRCIVLMVLLMVLLLLLLESTNDDDDTRPPRMCVIVSRA